MADPERGCAGACSWRSRVSDPRGLVGLMSGMGPASHGTVQRQPFPTASRRSPTVPSTAQAIHAPGHHDVDLASGHRLQEGVQAGTLVAALGSADALVGVGGDDDPARSGGDLLEHLQLVLDRLLVGGDTGVESCSLHLPDDLTDRWGVKRGENYDDRGSSSRSERGSRLGCRRYRWNRLSGGARRRPNPGWCVILDFGTAAEASSARRERRAWPRAGGDRC